MGTATVKQGATAKSHRLFVEASSSQNCASSKRGQASKGADFIQSEGCPVSTSNDARALDEALSRQREPSTIPIGSDSLPSHQDEARGVWLYPSERQFYESMKKKGWQPQKEDVGTVVQIHNAVNERAWREVLNWERLHATECGLPKLKHFRGRPNDYSPKAKLLNFLGYKLPFDRHDWVVDRCGRDVRYVIDFYNAAPLPDMPVAMHLDVRPALDSFEALWDRLRMQFRWISSKRWLSE